MSDTYDIALWGLVWNAIKPLEQRMSASLRKKGIRSALDRDGLIQDSKVRLVSHLVKKSSSEWTEKTVLQKKIWTILSNMVADHFRRTRQQQCELAARFFQSKSNGLSDDFAEQIETALESLPCDDAELIRRRFFDGCQLVEISKQLGLCPGSISRRIQNALETLRRTLQLEEASHV